MRRALQPLSAVVVAVALAFAVARCATGGDTTENGGGGDGSAPQPGDEGGAPPGDDSGPGCGDLQNDPKNCGSCGNVCPTDTLCDRGACAFGCTPPKSQCGGYGDAGASDAGVDGDADAAVPQGSPPFCTDLSNDPGNCGQCGVVCGPEHACVGGKCALSCDGGTTACTTADKCIAPGTCCTNADCADSGTLCVVPGTPCGCPTPDTFGTSCGNATPLAALGLGASVNVTGNLRVAGAENWFTATFSNNASTAYHPHVRFTANPNNAFAFDIQSNCSAGSVLTCPEGGACTSKTDWEVSYAGPNPPGDPNSPTFTPIAAVGTNGQVWIRVLRVAGTPSCDDFTLTVSN